MKKGSDTVYKEPGSHSNCGNLVPCILGTGYAERTPYADGCALSVCRCLCRQFEDIDLYHMQPIVVPFCEAVADGHEDRNY